VQDRRRGHRSRAGEHQANGGDRSRSRRRGTRREARAESDSAARRLEIWNVKLGLGLGAARSGACILYQDGEPGRGLVGPANGSWGHRAASGPPLWTGPCHGPGWRPKLVLVARAGQARAGGHRAVPFSGCAKTPGRGPGREPAGCMAIYGQL